MTYLDHELSFEDDNLEVREMEILYNWTYSTVRMLCSHKS